MKTARKTKKKIEFVERVDHGEVPQKFSLTSPRGLRKLKFIQAHTDYPGFSKLWRSKLKFKGRYLVISESWSGMIQVIGHSNSNLNLPAYVYEYASDLEV